MKTLFSRSVKLMSCFALIVYSFYYLRAMDKEKIYNALMSAFSLISDEYDSLCDEDLKDEYDDVLHSLESAMAELKK